MDEIKEQALPLASIRKPAVRSCVRAARIIWAVDPWSSRASVIYGRELWEDVARGGGHAGEFFIRPGPPDVMVFEVKPGPQLRRLARTISDLKASHH